MSSANGYAKKYSKTFTPEWTDLYYKLARREYGRTDIEYSDKERLMYKAIAILKRYKQMKRKANRK